jgi:hypothetical protein
VSAGVASSSIDKSIFDLRCSLLILPTRLLVNLVSTDSAYRLHLAAKPRHISLLSGSRVKFAMASHSAANRKNVFDALTGRSSLIFVVTMFCNCEKQKAALVGVRESVETVLRNVARWRILRENPQLGTLSAPMGRVIMCARCQICGSGYRQNPSF